MGGELGFALVFISGGGNPTLCKELAVQVTPAVIQTGPEHRHYLLARGGVGVGVLIASPGAPSRLVLQSTLACYERVEREEVGMAAWAGGHGGIPPVWRTPTGFPPTQPGWSQPKTSGLATSLRFPGLRVG